MADRGVSEALGFVLIFALVVTTLGVVYVTGMAGLTDARDAERVNNAERAFDVLADNVEAITHRDAPSRATEVKLADAGLRVESRDRIAVSVDGGEPIVSTGEVVYDSNMGTDIVYSNGAVLRESAPGTVAVRDPRMSIDGDRAMIHLTDVSGVRSAPVSGDRTVLVRTDHRNTVTRTATDGSHTVTIEVETDRTDAWERTLRSLDDGSSCETSGTNVACTFETDRVYVTKDSLDVAFS
ncbi:DUF7289 family protein [Halalkalicoccus tibetensis]|uniref:Flagellin n=1 Tax=Halalkalicoccus tibetensis TaxID=175632 RepID=A0ABD5VBL4_9EURY